MFVFSENTRKEENLQEDILNLKKKQRSVNDAKAQAKGAAVKGYNPFESIFNAHVEAKKKALAIFKHEMKDAKDENNKVTLSTNFIVNKQFVWPKSGYMYVGVHVYMAGKKGFLSRLMSGAMSNWFTRSSRLGVKALQVYVKEMAGDAFSKQISDKTVFNAVGEKENEGKVSYFCALKIPSQQGGEE